MRHLLFYLAAFSREHRGAVVFPGSRAWRLSLLTFPLLCGRNGESEKVEEHRIPALFELLVKSGSQAGMSRGLGKDKERLGEKEGGDCTGRSFFFLF